MFIIIDRFFLLSILPPKQTWPDPIQKIWLSLNIEEAVQERTNDIEWVPITDIPIEMQQALLAIEDHNFYNHGAIDVEIIGWTYGSRTCCDNI